MTSIKKLDDKYEWYDRHLKRRFTSKDYIQYVFEQHDTEVFYESYNIYQNMLTLIHENHNNYKQELNDWLDEIFSRDNKYFIAAATDIRKKWFIPLLRSLKYKAKYKRNGKAYITSFNNGFIESMNNKVKLVKRNAYGYKYFVNLRKRILIHLNFGYEFV